MKASGCSVEAVFVGKRLLLSLGIVVGVLFILRTCACLTTLMSTDVRNRVHTAVRLSPKNAPSEKLPFILLCLAAAHSDTSNTQWESHSRQKAGTLQLSFSVDSKVGEHFYHLQQRWRNSSGRPNHLSGGVPRRLSGLLGRFLKNIAVWQPVEQNLPSINLNLLNYVAGKNRADQSSSFQTTVDDILTLFFRWFDSDNRVCAWPLQGLYSIEGLRRVHTHYGQQMVRDFSKKQDEMREDEEKRKSKLRSADFYSQLGAIKRRVASWFFDGNTFHRRGPEAFAIPKTLTEMDVGFFQGLPFNLLRVVSGVYASLAPESVQRLETELALRGVTSLNSLLSKSNFFDFFVLLDVFDESFAQIDVLREYVANWVKYDKGEFKPAEIPLGVWKGKASLEDSLTDPRVPVSNFPRCSTLTCTMRYSWQNTPERNIAVTKKDVNALKLLLIGSTGVSSCAPKDERRGWLHRVKRFFSTDAFERTVKAMRDWHRKEKVDAVLGLGDILGLPGPKRVHDTHFETKWYNTYIKDGGLDVPWLMILGDDDAVLSPSTQIRYHYTKMHHNWHMPNDFYTVTFEFRANLTLSGGVTEEDRFNTTVINLNTWDMLVGNPIANNMEGWTHKLHWLSEQLYSAAQKNTTWLLVTGHHPVVSTGPEGEQARLQYVLDLYKNGRPRGVESRLVQLLFLHYGVDAYISAHDYFMEYTALRDKDNDVTVSFISSGAGARLLDYHLGQGWIGRLRGALYPALCWAGRRILFSLDPGGCKPLSRDRDQAVRFYAPGQGAYEVQVVERVTRNNGFAALKLSKEYMVVEFIDSNSGKAAAHSVHRKSNKTTRVVRFLDPFAAGKVKYEELLLDRNAFERENEKVINNESEFYRHCPVLAERIQFCVQEMNGIVDMYDELAQEKESYETMDDAGRELLMAQGINVLSKTAQILGDMYQLANDHRKLDLLYKKLVMVKRKKPTEDHFRWAELLDLEKRYATARKRRRELTLQLTADDAEPDPGAEKELDEQVKLMKLLRKEMDDITMDIERTATEKHTDAWLTGEKTFPAFETAKESVGPEVKPLETSVEARIKRKEGLLRRHYKLLDELRSMPKHELVKMKPETEILKRQIDFIRGELMRLRQLLKRAQSPMLPSEVWEKLKIKEDLEIRLRQIKAYLFRLSGLPATTRFAPSTEAQVEAVETEKRQVEKEFSTIVDELHDRKPTPLQALYLDKELELRRNQQISQQGETLSAAELSMPQVEAALRKAENRLSSLTEETEKLHEQVLEELARLDEQWRKEHPGVKTNNEVVVGSDVEQLAEEDATKVVATNEITNAVSTLRMLKGTKEYITNLQEAVRLVQSSSPEEVKDIEMLWGPIESLPQKIKEAEKRANQLEKTLKEMEHQLQHDAPVVDNATHAAGADSRRLADIMDMFKEKREPSPYKKLERIDMGQMDPCMHLPFLEAAVKRRLQRQADADTKDKCVYELANQAYREQLRYIHPGVFFSQTASGMVPSLFDKPSVHVERTYSKYFGHTHLYRFKSILNEIREGLDWIHKHIALLSFEDVKKRYEEELSRKQEDKYAPPSGEELEWLDDEQSIQKATGDARH